VDFPDILHIPEGINFECTGCGNCCFRWPVPATEEDFQRIAELARQADIGSHSQATLFRKMPAASAADKLGQFAYTLEKQADGRCAFLTEENRCRLHAEFGAEAKPGMCQLFPYTFTDAPDGYYASVSFASTGVLLNSGKALSDQEEFLRTRLTLFKRLFPRLSLDWSKIEFYDGMPLRWSQYLSLEERLLQPFRQIYRESASPFRALKDGPDSTPGSTNFAEWQQEKRIVNEDNPLSKTASNTCWALLGASAALVSGLPAGVDLERSSLVETAAEKVDLLLLRHLLEFYFPADVYASRDDSFGAHALMQHLARPPEVVQVFVGEEAVSLAEICDLPLPIMPPEGEQLLSRFVYARVFSKLFFGPGLAHLSVMAGFHHLGVLIALLKIKLKCLNWERSKTGSGLMTMAFDFTEIAELVRALERRLTSARHSTEASTILQVLLESPQRFERIISLAQ
jgi:Fe-S-cluster containining protein